VSDSTTDVDASRFARFHGSLTRRDWTSLGGMYGFIVLLHVIGFGVLLRPSAQRHRPRQSGHCEWLQSSRRCCCDPSCEFWR